MSEPSRKSFTEILRRARAGEPAAMDSLLPLLYQELRRLASQRLRARGDARTLEPTALVHEVWLRLAGQSAAQVQDRAHLLGLCARVMRQVLVDKARRRRSVRRGGGVVRVETTLDRPAAATPEPLDVLALHDALERLAQLDPRKAQVVELRVFGGLAMAEVATALEVSLRTVEGDWFFARAWLRGQLDPGTR